tara:strand:+ start:5 stop:133 length:129 start_codon:yes stop_codon:yes gene_type:complete
MRNHRICQGISVAVDMQPLVALAALLEVVEAGLGQADRVPVA